MKKIVTAFLCFAFALGMAAPVSLGEQTSIAFRGFPWYSAFPVVDDQMRKIALGNTNIYSNDFIDSYSQVEWSVRYSDKLVKKGGVGGYYYEFPVAGYTADSAILYYMYPFDDNGNVLRDDNQALFYCARYEFKEIKDKGATFDDLKAKLVSLYGEGADIKTDSYTSVRWMDSAGNIAWLVRDKYEVRLAYAAGDSDDRLAKLRERINEEDTKAEADARTENVENANGL